VIAPHIAAFAFSALALLGVQELRIDKIQANHKLAVTTLVQEHAVAAQKQKDQAIKDQAAITDNYQGALNESRIRETSLRAAAARARTAAERLRDQARTAASRIHLPQTPASAVAEYASAANELFAQCTGAYQELGEKADGHAADARTLIEAWPRTKPASIP